MKHDDCFVIAVDAPNPTTNEVERKYHFQDYDKVSQWTDRLSGARMFPRQCEAQAVYDEIRNAPPLTVGDELYPALVIHKALGLDHNNPHSGGVMMIISLTERIMFYHAFQGSITTLNKIDHSQD